MKKTLFTLILVMIASKSLAQAVTLDVLGKIYESYDEPLNWQEASQFAIDRGGHLVFINSDSENRLIQDFVFEALDASVNTAPDGGGARYVWLGASDIEKENEWQWNDGTPVYRNETSGLDYWGTGLGHGDGSEPDNNGGQDCLAMGLEGWPTVQPGYYGSAGQWNDIKCSNELPFIVEYDELRLPDIPQQSLSLVGATDGSTSTAVISAGASSDNGETAFYIGYTSVNVDGKPVIHVNMKPFKITVVD